MAINIKELDQAIDETGRRNKAFMSKAFSKVGDSIIGYFLYDNMDEVTGEFYHNETAYVEEGKPFFPLLICNKDKEGTCVACDMSEGYRKVGANMQFYVPKTDTIYLWERSRGYFKDVIEWFDRIDEGVSILQQPFKISKSAEKAYTLIPEKNIDKEVKEEVRLAYTQKFPHSDLYLSLTNEQMEYFYQSGHIVPDSGDNSEEVHF